MQAGDRERPWVYGRMESMKVALSSVYVCKRGRAKGKGQKEGFQSKQSKAQVKCMYKGMGKEWGSMNVSWANVQ